MPRLCVENGSIALVVMLAACAAPRVTNAPPEMVESCEREIALITNRDLPPRPDDTMPGVETGEDVIDEARRGREEAEANGLAAWPDDALLYRCLAGRGVELDAAQARVLAEWEHKAQGNRRP